MNKKILTIIALAFGAIAFSACGAASTNTVATENSVAINTVAVADNTAVVVNKPANAPVENKGVKPAETTADVKPPVRTDDAVTADVSKNAKVGVVECDQYLEKYEACVNTKVPEAQRAALISPLEGMRTGWRTAATNAPAKAALAGGCKVALATAKQSMAAYSCDW